jgi:hypothetical protein
MRLIGLSPPRCVLGVCSQTSSHDPRHFTFGDRPPRR